VTSGGTVKIADQLYLKKNLLLPNDRWQQNA
jgi:hypothetical protein